MSIDPTTLHGLTLERLTVEELETCPEGATLDLPNGDPDPIVKRGGVWVTPRERHWTSGEVAQFAVPGRVLRIPAAPSPEDAAVPADPKSPVYSIGRFVVVTNSFGGRFVTDAAEWTPAKVKEWVDEGMDLDALLHAIAKAEGR